MAGTSKYTEGDKARVFVTLTANDGNIKRTSRDTGIPEQTIRNWKNEWVENPPELSEEQLEEALVFVSRAEQIRDSALEALARKIQKDELKGSELITAIGVLDDKITRAKGLATGRVEHVHQLPSVDEVRDLLKGAMQGAIEAAAQRQQEIVDADVVQERPTQKALLPAPTGSYQ